MRVLLVEPDRATAQSVELMLMSENMNVYTTDVGDEAFELAKLYDYDIVLLELNLPDMSGYEVLRSLRLAKVKTPVMIVSGMNGVQDKVRALGFGADDFMAKPIHRDELVGRMLSIVRRSRGLAESVVKVGNMTVNLDKHTCEVDNNIIHLTKKEFSMLELLALRKETCVTKEMFLNHIYGGMDEPEIKIIDVFMCKLRRKISTANQDDTYFKRHFIETIWGRGYVLSEPSPHDLQKSFQEKAASAPSISAKEIQREADLLREQLVKLKAELGASPEASLEDTIKLLQKYKDNAERELEDAPLPYGEGSKIPALASYAREDFSESSGRRMPGFDKGLRMPVGMVFLITSYIEIDTNEGKAANVQTGKEVDISPVVGTILELMSYSQGTHLNKSNLMKYIFEEDKKQNEPKLGMYMSQAQGALTQLVGREMASSIVQVFSGGSYGMPRIDNQLGYGGGQQAFLSSSASPPSVK